MIKSSFVLAIILVFSVVCGFAQSDNTVPYPVVGTGVTACYNNTTTITCPESSNEPFYGQFPGNVIPSYQNNSNMTVTDLNTGLTWQRSPDQNGNNNGFIEKADKLTWAQIQARVAELNSSNWGGYNDWRIPTIKELYSITYWNGTDPSGYQGSDTSLLTPFLYDDYFQFAYGQLSEGERLIDVQYASQNLYNELSWQGTQMLFGMNFADGRIKGYDLVIMGSDKTFSFIAVRGNTSYGINNFTNNGDSTISDNVTGLMWSKNDSRVGMNWQDALAWVQEKNNENYCGYNDWRLPNTKELQSIVDYTRSPGSTNSAAIDSVFNCTSIINEAGGQDWPWFWTSTTHRSYNGTAYGGAWAVYVCFGRAGAWLQKPGHTYYSYVDIHGAGAQRSSPKSGTYVGEYLGLDSNGHPVYGHGPQGDIIRINNFVRLVRGGSPIGINNSGSEIPSSFALEQNYPNPFNPSTKIKYELPQTMQVSLKVYDVLGKEISTLVNSYQNAGSYTVVFNGSGLSSGIYFYRIEANGNNKTYSGVKKMVLIK